VYEDVLYDREDHVLGTPGFMVAIAPQCSGYEGIGLVTVFLAIYLWLFRSQIRFPQALLLFPLGALAIWLANAVRITILIAIGSSFSREVALGGFHSQAGWIAFSAIALGLIYLAGRLGLFSRKAPAEPAAGEEPHSPLASALLVPLLVLMASVMLTSALSHGFDWLYPLRPILTAAALWRYRQVYRQWDWNWSWPSVLIGVGVFVVWMALEPEADGSPLGSTLDALPVWQKQAWLVFRVLGSVMLVPVAEELAFRGYLLRRLVSADFEQVLPSRFTWLSFLGSSLIFGLVHGRWLAGTLAGLAFAGAVYRRGRLADAVVAHMTTNALIAALVLADGRWSLWM
jgi:exosortase E/protease (VPEID-CTERM system)